MGKHYRQGDILFEVVDTVPAAAKPSNNKILAYGEVTGHCHQLEGVDFQRFDVGEEIYLKLGSDNAVVHDEHDTIPLQAGTTVKVTRQRQYDPMLSIAKPVVD